ncbi:MAG: RHS repeat-associated core domain-containing protein [Haliscomenobacter sp.]|nr:RHS repeat-associated core domain-containing protein [Haliscomenobacter sp.]
MFYLELRYDQLFTTSSPTGGTISGLSGTLQKGGNIAQMAWRVRGRERQAYTFTYDTLSRLKTASYFDVNTSGTATASNRFNETLTYDLRGNIGTLQRQGFIQSTCTFGQIDNLAYTYAAGTNRLTSVADASGKSEGFKPGSGAGYTYDGNGNLKSDSYKGISTITYNHLNLPKLITFSSGNTIEIVYDASGNKLRKIVKQGATVQYEQDYSGGIEYRKTPAAGTFRIEAIYHEEGRYFNLNVDASNTPSWRKEYALRDHLGSTRLLFADKDGDGMVEVTSNASTNEILQELHYYPFGLSYGGSHWMNDAARDNGYKYNGKELNEDWGLGWYDYGARWYMPDLGRWGAVDPLAEKYYSYSTASYAMNNPILFLDPNGMDNIIYLLVLNGADKNVDLDEFVKSANLLFSTLGLKTQVSVFNGDNFDISKIDATDGVAILGSDKQQIGEFAEKNLSGKVDESTYETLTDKNAKAGSEFRTSGDEWPEVTENPGNSGGRVTAIDASTLGRWKKGLRTSSDGEAGAFFLFHGAGHQAGISHIGGGFMAEGNYIRDVLINNPKSSTKSIYDLITCHETFSRQYAEKMKKRFQPNNQPPKVNYHKK